MTTVSHQALHQALRRCVASKGASRNGGLLRYETSSLLQEPVATLLLLKWADQAETEQEAMAIFEDRTYQPLLPPTLRWRELARLASSSEIAERLGDLAYLLENFRRSHAQPLSAWLHALVMPLRHMLEANLVDLHELVRLVDTLPLDTPGDRNAVLEAFDQVLADTSKTLASQSSTPPSIARLAVALADPRPGERVYDPCFGSGNLLLAAWQHAERSRHEPHRAGALLEVAGIEIDRGHFLIGLVRMLLAGIDSPQLEQGDSLEREAPSSPGRQGFDLVLANPPLGVRVGRDTPGYHHFPFHTGDSTGLFVQHALAQLKPHGRAVIVVPEGFLFRTGPERELRRQLLEQGQVEAVIRLPAGAFVPQLGIRGSLLVLSRQGGINRVRMVDAAPFFERGSARKAPTIWASMAQQLAAEVRRPELRTPRELPPGFPEGVPGTGALSRAIWEVSIEELAASDWDLTPRRRAKGGLDELIESVRSALGESGAVAPLAEVAEVMAGRYVKAADLLDEPPSGRAVGYIRIRDLAHGRVGRPSSWVTPDLAAIEQRWALQPGDVLVSKSGTIGKAALVRNGAVGSLAANGLYVLRANQRALDPGFLLAYLASPACQNWLSAQSRGAVIQHLNRPVLDGLPVPLPPMSTQARAAAQFHEFGTDALTFLTQSAGTTESDRLNAWLAEVSSKIPSFTPGLDETPALGLLEPLASMASTAQRWLEQEQVDSHSARWLHPFTKALLPLAGVALIPAGPGLLSVLQDAERGLQAMLEQATGHLPAEAQARAAAERLRDWLRAASGDLTARVGLRVRNAPGSLVAGTFAEFSIELENEGPLPLRGVRIDALPDWGSLEAPYLAEGGSCVLRLSGDVPKQSLQLTLRLAWQGRTLGGDTVGGDLELPVQVVEPVESAAAPSADLGGSPYVTGSPLEPHHGHNVFFGRDELIGRIRRQIAKHGNVVLLEGNRRAGKTSILKHLEGRTAIPGWLAVYSSLQGADGTALGVGVPTADVFREVARSIASAMTKLDIDVPLPNGQVVAAGKPALGIARACREGIGEAFPFSDFRDYLEAALSVLEPLGLGLVLMLDEFDKLQEGIDNGITSAQVPDNIRFLIQSYPKFSAILTGSRRLKRLREEYWSALYGLGTNIPVTALDIESARSVVVEPVRGKLSFSNEAVERVIEVTARQPYLMQCLCNRVFDYAVQTKSRSITASVVYEAAHSLVRDNEHFASLWDYAALGPETGRQRRQMILLLCAQSFKQGTHVGFGTLLEQLAQIGVDVDEEALDTDLAYLRELELIDYSGSIGDGEYRLAIPLMADWIEQQQDADVVASRARVEALEEDVGA